MEKPFGSPIPQYDIVVGNLYSNLKQMSRDYITQRNERYEGTRYLKLGLGLLIVRHEGRMFGILAIREADYMVESTRQV